MEDHHQPVHIAIIMDGNGRWASDRGLPRVQGHERGAESVREVTRDCARRGLGHLTLYAFSSENWRRPREETEMLMGLLEHYLVSERKEIMENQVQFSGIGRLNELPERVQKELNKTTEMSRSNTGLHLRLALNYGSRGEIRDAVVRLARQLSEGKLQEDDVTEESVRDFLYDPGMPDPDLLIRTAGEYRLSNFLLWQASYAEIWVTPTLWPDFGKEDLDEAIRAYSSRERRYGGIAPRSSP
ncbi:MAG: isoprenyl transferase [Planctomycetota bacterium]|nr:isoprenyl transferase [Planctomycetota bacterium]